MSADTFSRSAAASSAPQPLPRTAAGQTDASPAAGKPLREPARWLAQRTEAARAPSPASGVGQPQLRGQPAQPPASGPPGTHRQAFHQDASGGQEPFRQPLQPVEQSPLLRAEGVSLEYRSRAHTVRATHDVSFDVYRGDRFVLLGPSGCGKSSLLKAAGGFLAPSAGSISIHGQPVSGPGPDRIAVFQEFDQLPPWKTVKQNVMFPLLASKRLQRGEAEERALHWIAKVGLAGFADAYPHTLSGGMKQRVAIARALAMQPEVLLMDEPFAALDALTRRKMQEELCKLWEEARFTLLFVTHSIEEALVVGNRILLLSPHPGRVRAELNSHQFGLHSTGSPEFQSAASRIHRLLFDEDAGAAPESAGVPAAGQADAATPLSAPVPVPVPAAASSARALSPEETVVPAAAASPAVAQAAPYAAVRSAAEPYVAVATATTMVGSACAAALPLLSGYETIDAIGRRLAL